MCFGTLCSFSIHNVSVYTFSAGQDTKHGDPTNWAPKRSGPRVSPQGPLYQKQSLTVGNLTPTATLAELGARGDAVVEHKEVQALLGIVALALLVDGADEHAAGIDAHHLARREVHDGDAGLAH